MIVQTLDELIFGVHSGKWRETFCKKIFLFHGNRCFLLQKAPKKIRKYCKGSGNFGNSLVKGFYTLFIEGPIIIQKVTRCPPVESKELRSTNLFYEAHKVMVNINIFSQFSRLSTQENIKIERHKINKHLNVTRNIKRIEFNKSKHNTTFLYQLHSHVFANYVGMED